TPPRATRNGCESSSWPPTSPRLTQPWCPPARRRSSTCSRSSSSRRRSTSCATSSTTAPIGSRFQSPASHACLKADEPGKGTLKMTTVATSELDALVRREHSNPHSVLGAHPYNGGVVVRVLRPAANAVTVLIDGKPAAELQQIHPGGVFEGVIEDAQLPLRYRLELDYGDAGKFTIDDPYSFLPTIGELDQHLISEGRHEELYDKLGAHVREHQGVTGTAFAVWAPAARAVSVVGDFNSWDGRLHAMRTLGATGVWELFLPGIEPGERYKFEILGADGELRLKADPYAQEAEHPPQ